MSKCYDIQVRDAKIIHVLRCALADLEGIMPEYDPDGERTHSGWKTIKEIRELINDLRED